MIWCLLLRILSKEIVNTCRILFVKMFNSICNSKIKQKPDSTIVQQRIGHIDQGAVMQENTVGPPYLWLQHPWIQLTMGQKYLEKESRNFQRQNLNFPHINNYLQNIDIVQGIRIYTVLVIQKWLRYTGDCAQVICKY